MDCEAVNCQKLPSREASCSPTPLRGARAPCQDLPTFLKATVSGPADRPAWGRERHFSGNPESLTSLSQKPHWRGDSGGLEKRTVPPAGHQSLGERGALLAPFMGGFRAPGAARSLGTVWSGRARPPAACFSHHPSVAEGWQGVPQLLRVARTPRGRGVRACPPEPRAGTLTSLLNGLWPHRAHCSQA